MLLFLTIFSCSETKITETALPDPVYITEGSPKAGLAETFIDFPLGTPLGGYSARCNYLGGTGKADNRKSAYALAFNPSAGLHTMPNTKVIWLENEDQHFVLIKADVIYIYDGLVEEIEAQLEAQTGIPLDGKVSITASHSHHAPANFSDQIHFYLGGDRYNEEIFRRFVKSMVDISVEAYNTREDVSIGFSQHKDWDSEDEVYSDRRGENDDLELWPDQVEGKHPYLWIMRIDDLEGNPKGLFYHFPIHGTMLGGGNTFISTDASGQIEIRLADRFGPDVVVAHIQGPAGDISPVGSSMHGHKFAQLEALGERALEKIYTAWEQTPTSSEAFTMESVNRAVPQSLEEVRVTRNGTVDWYYPPYDESSTPDDQIYAADGSLLSPFDEFKAQYGAAFCGYDDPLISTGTIGSQIPPYNGCMQVELVSYVINGVFQLTDFWEDGEAPLPLPGSRRASVAATRIGPVSILDETGTQSQSDLLMGFFPGEATTLFADQYRRRAQEELGFNHTMTVAYAQDHEGYLLIPEDWLLGGYEPNINIWGPLQGEYLIEHSLSMVKEHLTTDLLEPQDPDGKWQPYDFPERELPELAPDITPAAGTAVTEMPEYLYNYFPDLTLALAPSATVRRGQDIAQFVWEGGDTGVDRPHVILERKNGETWEEVTTEEGMPVDERRGDILLSYTPTPLYPLSVMQSTYYWIGWQAVGTNTDRMGFPEGVYRFHIYGKSYTGNNNVWPWDTEDYNLTSPEFTVAPAELTIDVQEEQISIALMGHEQGFRLLSMDGSSNGANPPIQATLFLTHSDGTTTEITQEPVVENGYLLYTGIDLSDTIQIDSVDAYGNTGTWVQDGEASE
jgi:neutral ceramidase